MYGRLYMNKQAFSCSTFIHLLKIRICSLLSRSANLRLGMHLVHRTWRVLLFRLLQLALWLLILFLLLLLLLRLMLWLWWCSMWWFSSWWSSSFLRRLFILWIPVVDIIIFRISTAGLEYIAHIWAGNESNSEPDCRKKINPDNVNNSQIIMRKNKCEDVSDEKWMCSNLESCRDISDPEIVKERMQK